MNHCDSIEMPANHDAPTAEQVADTAGGDVESAERALLAVRFRNPHPSRRRLRFFKTWFGY